MNRVVFPTLLASFVGDEIVIAPIGWTNRVPRQAFTNPGRAVRALQLMQRATGSGICWVLTRTGGSNGRFTHN